MTTISRRKIKWFEKPTTVSMTNSELEDKVRSQSGYLDIMPNAWNTDWSSPMVQEAEVYDDCGVTYLRARRSSKNSWRVQTTF